MVLGGTGLHSGDKTGLILTPLPPDSGIIFGNISNSETIQADIDFVISTSYATSLKNTNTVAHTVEHLLAALHAYRITNLMIKINNEVHIMDGSALDFCQIIEDAGIEDQDKLLDEFVINERHTLGEVKKMAKFITIEPANELSIHYILQYPKPVGRQEYTFTMGDEEMFKKEKALEIHYQTSSPRLDIYGVNQLTLAEIPPGKYLFKAILHDVIKGEVASATWAFEVTK